MPEEYYNLTDRILKLLEKDPGQAVQKLANELKINRTFLAGYLKALENEGKVKSKRIGPARVYFSRKDNEV
jgi:predicted transcriptional regulator